jgi:hypothetical protein
MKAKLNLKCTLYKFLFRVLPVNAWKVFIMNTHFGRCPYCREKVEADETARQLLVSLQKAQTLPTVWPSVLSEIEMEKKKTGEEKVKPAKEPTINRWQWAAAVGMATIMLLLLLFFPFSTGEKPSAPLEFKQKESGTADQVVIKSVKIGSEAGKFYVFHSEDPDKLIIWAQKKSENHGG